MELTNLQQETVEKLLRYYQPQKQVICEFKSPTGSGKTLMASAFISHLIERNAGERLLFVIATPSSSSLPFSFEQKINKYKKDLPFSRFEVEHIKSPSSNKTDKTESIPKILPEQNKVYIFGKSSFGKGRILSEYGIIDDFVKNTIEQGFRLIYIRDEAHIGGERNDNSIHAQNFETLMTSHATFVLKMTATFNHSSNTRVELTERELNDPRKNENRYLLKTTFKPIIDRNMEDTEVLSEAIKKFKKIKEDYAKLDIGIHPAMLIQVDNSSTTNKERQAEFEAALIEIKKTLDRSNLSWVQYFGDGDKDSNRVYKSNFSLDDITRNNNDIDTVIFKIGPATGWDIPRACMLVQLRNVSSENLNTQTLGRIKRNPYPNLEKNEVTDKYWVLSNIREQTGEQLVINYKVREEFAEEQFLCIALSDSTRKELKKKQNSITQFQKEFKKYLNEHKNAIEQQLRKSFGTNGTTYKKKIMNAEGGLEICYSITNPFIFLRDYKRLTAKNSFLYLNIKAIATEFAEKAGWQKEFLITMLLSEKEYQRKIFKIMDKTRNISLGYKVNTVYYLPKNYEEYWIESEQRPKSETNDNYLFDIETGDVTKNNQQPLDSNNEEIIFAHIKQFIKKNKTVRLWAKNQTNSNIYSDYLDQFKSLHKSYFDYIIKFENGYYLYLEVKGSEDNDINKDKTALLRAAYASYFKDYGDLFSKKNLVIAICQVDKDRNIFTEPFYYKNNFSEKLEEYPFEEFLEILSKKVVLG